MQHERGLKPSPLNLFTQLLHDSVIKARLQYFDGVHQLVEYHKQGKWAANIALQDYIDPTSNEIPFEK